MTVSGEMTLFVTVEKWTLMKEGERKKAALILMKHFHFDRLVTSFSLYSKLQSIFKHKTVPTEKCDIKNDAIAVVCIPG